jgi:type I restriction enzyme R subunit
LPHYQREAVEAAIAARKRRMLVTMATGTGKTLTMVNEVYRLMKSAVARRVLFLVDRRALALQAVRAFRSFEAEPGPKFDKIDSLYSQRFQRADLDEDEAWDPTTIPNALLARPQLGDTFVYVCTIQRMAINLFGPGVAIHGKQEAGDDEDNTWDLPIHAFDLIIADECHRGYSAREASVWLTATPAKHTVAFFKDVVYRYEYERAVRERYLVDYDAVRLRSGVRMEGVFLKEGDQVDEIDPITGEHRFDYLEDERVFEAGQVEREITAPDSNRKILVVRHA